MGNCFNSAVIDAPCDAVWETIRDFHDLSWAEGVITKLTPEGDAGGGEVGAARVLNEVFHETLRSIDHDARAFTYSIDDGPGPLAKDAVRNYLGSVRLIPVTDANATLIVWESSYETDDDSAVGDFCNPIYFALLKALKAHFA